ncbi:MAG: hypothetical protein J0I09_08445 [Sphingobacteriia bacterium]|nr:hypothetical protein [Sphingobacteriia bacterium]
MNIQVIINSTRISFAVKKVAKRIGIDRAISYVLIGRGISLLAQPLTLFFIGKYLSKVEQGFYYTFNNIIMLSILLELGLGTILTQFASHEFAHLQWENKILSGEDVALQRILSLIKKSIKWYIVMVAIFFVIVTPTGLFFFKSQSVGVNYIMPWVLLVFFSAINLVIYAFTAAMEGCNKVTDIQLMKMIQSILASISIWLVLLSKGGLLAATAVAFTQCIIAIIWLKVRYNQILKQVFSFSLDKNIHQISWGKEVFPVQWKIALSWISGYVMSQVINPALFKYRGAIEAGQMGMSMSIANIPIVIGLAWLNTKSPSYGSYIKLNKINELKQLVRKNTVLSVSVTALASVFVFIGILIVKKYFSQFGERFLPVEALFFLMISNIALNFNTSVGLYMRSFKKEPFLAYSIINAVFTGIIVLLCAYYANAQILCIITSCFTLFFSTPYCYILLKRFNRTLNS